VTGRKRKPKSSLVSDLLAAPESVAKNERERTKALQRKAKEKAKAEQLRNGKRFANVQPTPEDLLADIIRVAEDEATNPYHEFRSISRRRYELYGHYPIEHVDREYGQFNHALEVAGLRDQPGSRLWRANRARASRSEHAARYYDRYVRPYVADPDQVRMPRRGYVLLSISDTHSQFLCPFVWAAFLQVVRDLRPDGVLLNGDTFEGSEISSHPKIPGWTQSLQSELDFHRTMFAQVRKVHDGDLFSTCGNHDLGDRLSRYLTQVAPALANLRDLRVDRLMGLDAFDVKLFHGGTPLSPPGTVDAKPGLLLFGFYRIHHGTRTGINAAREELRDAGRSGQSGHIHRAGLAFGTTERDEGLSWMTTPMGARHEVGRSYIKGTNNGWQRGFGIATLYPDGSVQQSPIVVSGNPDRLTVEGRVYERTAKCLDPEPQGNWLEGLKL